jgi:Ankyrin repeats (many copies)
MVPSLDCPVVELEPRLIVDDRHIVNVVFVVGIQPCCLVVRLVVCSSVGRMWIWIWIGHCFWKLDLHWNMNAFMDIRRHHDCLASRIPHPVSRLLCLVISLPRRHRFRFFCFRVRGLHYAADSGKLDAVRWLVEEKQLYINMETNEGETPLHLAAYQGKLDVVKWLVGNRDVDINVETNEGETPLQYAAGQGKAEVMEWLLNMGSTSTWRQMKGRQLCISQQVVGDWKLWIGCLSM